METIKIKPKTQKGKNRVESIRRKNRNWDKETWIILQKTENVLFDPFIGGWFLIIPECDKELGIRSDYVRWFNQFNDSNFTKV